MSIMVDDQAKDFESGVQRKLGVSWLTGAIAMLVIFTAFSWWHLGL
jgi:hypothetical protein